MLANGISPVQTFLLIAILGIFVGWISNWLMSQSDNRSMGISDAQTTSLKDTSWIGSPMVFSFF